MNELILAGIVILYIMGCAVASMAIGIELEDRVNVDAFAISMIALVVILSITLIVCGLLIG